MASGEGGNSQRLQPKVNFYQRLFYGNLDEIWRLFQRILIAMRLNGVSTVANHSGNQHAWQIKELKG